MFTISTVRWTVGVFGVRRDIKNVAGGIKLVSRTTLRTSCSGGFQFISFPSPTTCILERKRELTEEPTSMGSTLRMSRLFYFILFFCIIPL